KGNVLVLTNPVVLLAQVEPPSSERRKNAEDPKLPTGATWYTRLLLVRLNLTKPPSPPSTSIQPRAPEYLDVPLSWRPPKAIFGSVGWRAMPWNWMVFKFPLRLVQ